MKELDARQIRRDAFNDSSGRAETRERLVLSRGIEEDNKTSKVRGKEKGGWATRKIGGSLFDVGGNN